MKRTNIKPVATVTRVETQTSYCNATSFAVYGRKFHDYGEVEVDNPASDMGRVITDKDLAEHDYNPWNPENW